MRVRARLANAIDGAIMLPTKVRIPAAGTLPTVTVSNIVTGTGAAFTAIGDATNQCQCIYQSTAHSVVSTGDIEIDTGI